MQLLKKCDVKEQKLVEKLYIYVCVYIYIYIHCIALIAQLCPTLWEPMDSSPPCSSIHGILQARNWSWLPFPSPGDLPNSGIKPRSPTLQVDSLPSEPPGKPIQYRITYNGKESEKEYIFVWVITKSFCCTPK